MVFGHCLSPWCPPTCPCLTADWVRPLLPSDHCVHGSKGGSISNLVLRTLVLWNHFYMIELLLVLFRQGLQPLLHQALQTSAGHDGFFLIIQTASLQRKEGSSHFLPMLGHLLRSAGLQLHVALEQNSSCCQLLTWKKNSTEVEIHLQLSANYVHLSMLLCL